MWFLYLIVKMIHIVIYNVKKFILKVQPKLLCIINEEAAGFGRINHFLAT